MGMAEQNKFRDRREKERQKERAKVEKEKESDEGEFTQPLIGNFALQSIQNYRWDQYCCFLFLA